MRKRKINLEKYQNLRVDQVNFKNAKLFLKITYENKCNLPNKK